ncbi:adenosylcobinamide-phosphate synthase CbiB [Pacificibacter marinus]|uniref:Cobalamin biosynthesis protein CobD n=1 Tax=Pacificibacter marinus TaxID=658057 RepID=A0A1Y5S5B3_9RHOB|nr:adenosylcobinamide-phosphate synthase CbiB [Pacificibacter marinus]SEK90583.1 adenosylcobinamide-phosphate synthase [Pacificibacter marinus]SLN32042.1 cobalamin biosynthesis protein [Pacificibacter marinus]
MTTALTLFCALILDAIFGEPKWLWTRLPHPAVLMGRLIGWADTRFNTGSKRKTKGVILLIALVILGGSLGYFIALVPYLSIFAAAILIAHKSLIQHVKAVAHGLELSLDQGRNAVAMIVGRDTAAMDAPAVARAAIESAAENFSDGVIAPAFWFLIGGLPGLVIYKMVNTADSMIGYLTPKHADFGWASARFDDLLNLIPARVTMLLLMPFMTTIRAKPFSTIAAIARDARKHRSPNAGWPEAALSRSLGIAVSGPRAYHGEMKDYPWVNETGRKIAHPYDIHAACQRLWVAWAAVIFFCLWMVFATAVLRLVF